MNDLPFNYVELARLLDRQRERERERFRRGLAIGMQIRAQRTTRTGNGQMRASISGRGRDQRGRSARRIKRRVRKRWRSARVARVSERLHAVPWTSVSVLHPQSTVPSAVRDQRRDLLLLLPRVRVLFYLKVKH
jgi:hypothetical protein